MDAHAKGSSIEDDASKATAKKTPEQVAPVFSVHRRAFRDFLSFLVQNIVNLNKENLWILHDMMNLWICSTLIVPTANELSRSVSND